jgi:hypothetical protein
VSSSRQEVDAYLAQWRWLVVEMSKCLVDLSPTQMGARPHATANSPFQVANHVLGATRVLALGLGCGRQLTRDRRSEFNSKPERASDVIWKLGALLAELEAGLGSIDPKRLDEHVQPDPALELSISTERSRRDALIESIRHGGIHLGELRLVRDLVAPDI